MNTCPTLKVKNPAEEGGFMIINESDFVEGEHEHFEEAPGHDLEGDHDDHGKAGRHKRAKHAE